MCRPVILRDLLNILGMVGDFSSMLNVFLPFALFFSSSPGSVAASFHTVSRRATHPFHRQCSIPSCMQDTVYRFSKLLLHFVFNLLINHQGMKRDLNERV